MSEWDNMIIDGDEIDFAAYERETDHKQKIKPASLWIDELMERIRNPQRDMSATMPWVKSHGLLRFRPGEVTIWGGANGQGKSLVTGMTALSLGQQGEKVCLASFEMKPIKTLERMGRQWSGDNPDHPAFRGQPEATESLLQTYTDFRGWADGRLWLYDQQGTVNASQVISVVRYCAKERGITHFFVDSLMKCVAAEDDYNGQKMFVDELTSIARDTGIHVHLVHHIKKPANEDYKPNKYDYKGSGAITDLVDNVITMWRNKPKEKLRAEGKPFNREDADALLICDKQRNGEWEGTIGLWFDANSQQYLPESGAEPMRFY